MPTSSYHTSISNRDNRMAVALNGNITKDATSRLCVDYLTGSRLSHRICAVFLLIPAAPLIGLLALLIRLTSPGPAIFRQSRVGLHGRTFHILKLRTMRCDAEVGIGPVWAARRDPRVTPLGRILRKLHLDELPQLWNVIRGEMAFIGPRPERPEFVRQLAVEIPGYMDRHSVLPGVTGLAQIRLPPDTDLESVRLKLEQDLEYLTRANALLDLRIVGCTAFRSIGLPGQWSARLFWLQYSPVRETAAPCDDQCTPLSTLSQSTSNREAKEATAKRRKPR